MDWTKLQHPLLIAVVAQIVLLLIVWLSQLGLGLRMRRIESRLAALEPEPIIRRTNPEAREGKRLFAQWLSEDPARRDLPKKEQFAGFRQWRAEQGLNWDPERKEG